MVGGGFDFLIVRGTWINTKIGMNKKHCKLRCKNISNISN